MPHSLCFLSKLLYCVFFLSKELILKGFVIFRTILTFPVVGQKEPESKLTVGFVLAPVVCNRLASGGSLNALNLVAKQIFVVFI